MAARRLPRSYLAAELAGSRLWRTNFVRTFLERDIPQLGIRIPAETLRRFWTMVAHYHGQVWNGAEFARALGVSQGAVRGYLDILTGAFLVRALAPWFENLKKRQVKAPKVYVRDTGLLHTLLDIGTETELAGHPKTGASFEGFAIEQLLTLLEEDTAFFWATHGGAELDLLVSRGGMRYGFECKMADAPGTTRSMRVALDDLGLDYLWVLYPGDDSCVLDDRIAARPVSRISELVATVKGGGFDA